MLLLLSPFIFLYFLPCITSTKTNDGYHATLYLDRAAIETDSLTNIYLEWSNMAVKGTMSLSFGNCDSTISSHQVIGTTELNDQLPFPTKFIWRVPSTTVEKGCLFATHQSTGNLLARSKPYGVSRVLKKRTHPELQDMYFDGIKHYMDSLKKSKNSFVVNSNSKQMRIGIIGAGISGLFSAYLLQQAGFKNIEIIEANNRVGGRIYTAYFRNSTTVYHELGAMRIPVAWTHENITLPIRDQYTLLQLIDELNNMTDADHRINLIPWIQSNPNNLVYFNGYRLSDGRVPTNYEASNLTQYRNTGVPEDIAAEAQNSVSSFINDKWLKKMANDFYGAYKEYLENGYSDWSEAGWLFHKLHASLGAIDYRLFSESYREIWTDMCDALFFSTDAVYRTIQGGMSRLPNALRSIFEDKVTFNTKITRIEFKNNEQDGTQSISTQWKTKPFDTTYHSMEFDKVIVAVPFAVVRNWHLPKELPYILSRAIMNLEDKAACKVILEFKTRFWEKYEDRPIFGGCDKTDLPIAYICYPSNDLGADGPGVMIAAYATDSRMHFSSMSEEEHVANVLDNVVEMHGEVAREQFTGNYKRMCWSQNPYAATSWAAPLPEQRKFYTPSYYEYAKGLVFVGEHTDIQEGWIVAALNSAIRGVAMVLIDLGHVDEARKMVTHWNATWLNI